MFSVNVTLLWLIFAAVLRLCPSTVLADIYWDASVEEALPTGFTATAHHQFASAINATYTTRLHATGCGRMQNRLASLADGTHACVRYRQNVDQIQGEVYSAYLARILHLPNVVPTLVKRCCKSSTNTEHLNSTQMTTQTTTTTAFWTRCVHDMTQAGWDVSGERGDRSVALTRYVHDLYPARIPPAIRQSILTNTTFYYIDETDSTAVRVENRTRISFGDTLELAQWSDLLVFDYLTANLDRLVNNLYNLQWNSGMLEAPAHNLLKRRTDGLLVFLDNESGLVHGYRLLAKYDVYHRWLLGCMCRFRKRTVLLVSELRRRANIGALFEGLYASEMATAPTGSMLDDEAALLPRLMERTVSILNERIKVVYRHMRWCGVKYGQKVGRGEEKQNEHLNL